MAPEVVVAWPGRNTEQPYTAVVDEWSVGMVFYDVVHGDSPFLVDKQAPSDANDPDETANQRWEKVFLCM